MSRKPHKSTVLKTAGIQHRNSENSSSSKHPFSGQEAGVSFPINEIICGDAKRILRTIPERCVHLIVTSPPYNVGIPYESYDDRQPYEKYLQEMEHILAECYRVLVKGGRICINLPSCAMQHTGSRAAWLTIDYVLMLRKVGFLDREFIGWLKSPYLSVWGRSTSWGSWKSPSNPALRDIMEYIVVMHKETPKLEGEETDLTKDEFLEFTHNAWTIIPSTRMRKFHPSPFPFELPRRLIKLYSFVRQTVLDPFCGVGTTCLVAKELGRNYIGIDISERYCEMARRFLAQRNFEFL